MIGIGIDTGGTCTDAVVFDTASQEVLDSAKALTTKRDLKVGIIEALSCLDESLRNQAEFLSLSTTLATNACVEEKGGRAKLCFIGITPAYVNRMSGVYGLPPSSEIYFMKGDPADERDTTGPDWEQFRKDVKDVFGNYDSAAIVQISPTYNNGEYEKTAAQIVREEVGIPCVLGYDLFQEINIQKRGATALLNARLLPIMEGFFASVKESLQALHLEHLPIRVVKSDGSTMNMEFAEKRPVETLLCGPAASLIGAGILSKQEDALVIDIGGTTSDVAIIRDGSPQHAAGGIRIGRWNTLVKGVNLDTFGLGGDSGIRWNEDALELLETRVVPLCVLANQHPRILDVLEAMVKNYSPRYYPAEKFLLLNADVPVNQERRYKDWEWRLLKALASGPLSFEEGARAAGISPYVFHTDRLEQEGVVITAGMTPTDLMHIQGSFTDYEAKASELGLAYLQAQSKKSKPFLCEEIERLVQERLYRKISQILLKYELGSGMVEKHEAALDALTQAAFAQRCRMQSEESPDEPHYLAMHFQPKKSFIGIGAPTAILLGNMETLFGTEIQIPPYAGVANAVGAAAGRIMTEHVVKLTLKSNGEYLLTGGETTEMFQYYQDGLTEAKRVAEACAIRKAKERGAGTIEKTTVDVQEDYFEVVREDKVMLIETIVTAKTVS